MSSDPKQSNKSHHSSKPNKKFTARKQTVITDAQRARNHKAFIYQSAGAAKKARAYKVDREHKKHHVPLVNRLLETDSAPPILIAVVGPPKVGKTTLIKSLVKHYNGTKLPNFKGPITLVAGKSKRITFIECDNNLNSMCDLAKTADLILLLIDASFGFEMETFEFLNIAQTHGFPKIMGVLTHLDKFNNAKTIRSVKKTLKSRFWMEVYDGAKLFYLSGVKYNNYSKTEIANLARFISVMKFRPLIWRNSHSYLLVDRYEDITDPGIVSSNPLVNRTITFYGYVRGTYLKPTQKVHLLGVGDYDIEQLNALDDPCAAVAKKSKHHLQRDKKIYAPMTDIGETIYDADGIYLSLRPKDIQYTDVSQALDPEQDPEVLAKKLQEQYKQKTRQLEFGDDPDDIKLDAPENIQFPVPDMSNPSVKMTSMDENMKDAEIQYFKGSSKIVSKDVQEDQKEEEDEYNFSSDEDNGQDEDSNADRHIEVVQHEGRTRRRVVFDSVAREAESSDDEDNDIIDEEDQDDNSDYNENSEQDEEEIDVDDDEKLDAQLLAKIAGLNEKKVVPLKESSSDNIKNLSKRIVDLPKPKVSSTTSKKSVIPQSDDENEDVETGGEDSDMEDVEENEEDEDTVLNNRLIPTLPTSIKKNSLMDLIYGDVPKSLSGKIEKITIDKKKSKNQKGKMFDSDSDSGDELFTPKAKKNIDASDGNIHSNNAIDSNKIKTKTVFDRDALISIKSKFITGTAPPQEEGEEGVDKPSEITMENDAEVFGDWEDLEEKAEESKEIEVVDDVTGISVSANASKTNVTEDEAAKIRAAKKLALKESFDASYDGKTIQNPEDEENGGEDESKKAQIEAEKRAKFNKQEFETMNAKERFKQEGARVGQYVRVCIRDIPCEFIKQYDIAQPLVIGALLNSEHATGFVQVRMKKHRWHKRLLKNSDPLIISLGWRRFQTLPLFSLEDRSQRQRLIKYSPEHMHCIATFYGPVTPPGTGMLAFQNFSTTSAFRISSTGVVLALDSSFKIIKKLKLTGSAYEIHKHTAFIKDMFNSELEVAKFENASLKTVSGIRGMIKKALTGKNGKFRAMFEDRILMSDIVMLRTWTTVEPKMYYNPVTSFLTKEWQGMRSMFELRRDNKLAIPIQKDSLYKDIARKVHVPKEIRVPKSLAMKLPFKDKPQVEINVKNKYEVSRQVIPDDDERRRNKFLSQAKMIQDEQNKRDAEISAKKRVEYLKRKNQEDDIRGASYKEHKKKKYELLGKKSMKSYKK